MKYRLALLALRAAVVGLAGCHPLRAIRNVGGTCRDKQPYMKAQSIAPLRIPPGMDMPDTSNALHIPALNEPQPPPRTSRDPCLDAPPSFRTAKQAPPQA